MDEPRTRAWARRPAWLTRASPSQTSPADAGSSRPRRFSRVDFPEPDGPVTATNSPPLTSRSMPWSTGTTVPCGPGYVLERPVARSIDGSRPSADRLRRGQAHDVQGRVGGRQRSECDREDDGRNEQAGGEQEELLRSEERRVG